MYLLKKNNNKAKDSLYIFDVKAINKDLVKNNYIIAKINTHLLQKNFYRSER